MFDLDMIKVQFEKVYTKTKNMLISSELLKSYNKTKNGVLILGAGNQADTAFSPKALELADKSKKTVFIIRNHLFSEFHTRSFFNVLLQIIKENKTLYRTYIEILAGISFIKSKQKVEDTTKSILIQNLSNVEITDWINITKCELVDDTLLRQRKLLPSYRMCDL